MSTVDELKKRMSKCTYSGVILYNCPICGAAPKLKRWDLGYGNGRGYPGHSGFQYTCSGCGLINSCETTDIYDEDGKPSAEQRIAKDWNEVAAYINELIEKTHNIKK